MGAQPEGVAWPKGGELEPSDVEVCANRPFVAYVHVPFCSVRCGYCDFNTYTKGFGSGADLETYMDSVAREIDQSVDVLSAAGFGPRPLQSVFFGGGTPSLLDPISIEAALRRLEDSFGFASDVEITLETNPETVSGNSMERFAAAGINRVSMGVQSAVPRVLQILDRQHSPAKVPVAVDAAKKAGLRVSLDLIYGAPTESLEEWKTSLNSALDLDPEHLSAYSLIVEPGTKMAAQIARGELRETDPDLEAEKYEFTDLALSKAGLNWYEISNFSKTLEDRSVHNLAYWRDWDWWGYGPGSHSHVGRLRWWNVKHPRAYAGRLESGQSPAAAGETLSDEQRSLEQLMLAIRTVEGIQIDALPDRKGIGRLLDEGVLEPVTNDDQRLRLTLKGRLLADYATRVLSGWED